MVDFSKLKGLTIPEGAVTQIADENGNVLWSGKKTAKIAITSLCQGINGDTSSITVTSTEPFAPDPTNPSHTTTSWTAVCWEQPNCTIELLVGSTIACAVRDTKTAERRCYVELNGTKVLSEAGTYVYTVTRDAAVHVTDKYAMGEYGMITITE